MEERNSNIHDPNDHNHDSGGSPPAESDRLLKSGSELLTDPKPRWLVKNVMEANALVMMYGKPGSAKSFVALDLAMHLANGVAWHGIRVMKTDVVYVVAEGGKGVSKRIAAFVQTHPTMTGGRVFFHLRALPLNSEDHIKQLHSEVSRLGIKPGLLVIDTLARCFDGEENSSKETGVAIRELDTLRRDLGGATVLLVHHTKKNGEDFRGSSALAGAVDTMLAVSKNAKGVVTLKTEKQKDEANAKPVRWELQVIDLGKDEDGDPVRSCALCEATRTDSDLLPGVSDWTKSYVEALANCGGLNVSCGAWLDAIEDLGEERRQFDKRKTALLRKGFASKTGKSRAVRWSLTREGIELVKRILEVSQTEANDSFAHAIPGGPLRSDINAQAGDGAARVQTEADRRIN